MPNDTNNNGILSGKQDIASRRSRQSRREQVIEEEQAAEEDDDEFDEQYFEEDLVSNTETNAQTGPMDRGFLETNNHVVEAFAVGEDAGVEEPRVLASAEPFQEENKTTSNSHLCHDCHNDCPCSLALACSDSRVNTTRRATYSGPVDDALHESLILFGWFTRHAH